MNGRPIALPLESYLERAMPYTICSAGLKMKGLSPWMGTAHMHRVTFRYIYIFRCDGQTFEKQNQKKKSSDEESVRTDLAFAVNLTLVRHGPGQSPATMVQFKNRKGPESGRSLQQRLLSKPSGSSLALPRAASFAIHRAFTHSI